jgi:hypothetical protein
MNDLTIIYYTANMNKDFFMANTQKYLLKAIGETPIITVSFKPTLIGNNCKNICIGEQERCNYTLYLQVLMGAREANTKYVAMAEDDMLYSKEHFMHRPPDDETFSYDVNKWSIFSWQKPPIFSFRVRKLMNSLIVTKEALVKNLEERYRKYPNLEKIHPRILKYYWAEPGRFENHLGITPVKVEEFMSPIPNIMFSTSEAMGYTLLGNKKAHGPTKKDKVEPWGTAEEIQKIYG